LIGSQAASSYFSLDIESLIEEISLIRVLKGWRVMVASGEIVEKA